MDIIKISKENFENILSTIEPVTEEVTFFSNGTNLLVDERDQAKVIAMVASYSGFELLNPFESIRINIEKLKKWLAFVSGEIVWSLTDKGVNFSVTVPKDASEEEKKKPRKSLDVSIKIEEKRQPKTSTKTYPLTFEATRDNLDLKELSVIGEELTVSISKDSILFYCHSEDRKAVSPIVFSKSNIPEDQIGEYRFNYDLFSRVMNALSQFTIITVTLGRVNDKRIPLILEAKTDKIYARYGISPRKPAEEATV